MHVEHRFPANSSKNGSLGHFKHFSRWLEVDPVSSTLETYFLCQILTDVQPHLHIRFSYLMDN